MGIKSSQTYELHMFLQLILFLSLSDVLKIGFAMQPSMAESSSVENEVQIGANLDMSSWNGRTMFSCIEKGDILQALSAGGTYSDATFFPFKGLANVLTLSKWSMVNIFYEDSDYTRDSSPYLFESLKEQDIMIGVEINYGFPELLLNYHDPLTNGITFKGCCIEVFHAAIISSLDYQVSYEHVPYEKKGSYIDLINQVYLGEFNGVVGDTRITGYGSLYADFKMPSTNLWVGNVAKRSILSDISTFSRRLNPQLWLTSGVVLAFYVLVVWNIEHSIDVNLQSSIIQEVTNCKFTRF